MFNQQHVKTRTASLTFYSVAAILLTATARCAEQQADESKIDEKKNGTLTGLGLIWALNATVLN